MKIALLVLLAICAPAMAESNTSSASEAKELFFNAILGHGHPYLATENGFSLSAKGAYCEVRVERDGDILTIMVCNSLMIRRSGDYCGSVHFNKNDKPDESSMHYESIDQNLNLVAQNEPRLKVKVQNSGDTIRVNFFEPKKPWYLEDRLQHALKFTLKGEKKNEIGNVTIFKRTSVYNSPEELEFSCSP